MLYLVKIGRNTSIKQLFKQMSVSSQHASINLSQFLKTFEVFLIHKYKKFGKIFKMRI